jgi:hypothetical protein
MPSEAQIPDVSPPYNRALRSFAYDPGLSGDLENFEVSEVRVTVPWEKLDPGPVGDYLEVVDVDPASQCAYAPVDLEHPHLIASEGLAPSEGNPQFHQQMVYAVGMKTIHHFERALGRKIFWSDRELSAPERKKDPFATTHRLRIYPHALRENNAYYDSSKKALLFGYFPAEPEIGNEMLPGGVVFTCLSHDIIAHEMTHAILDGVQPKLLDPSNADALAFHEAFADIVALFQHFTYPEILAHQLARAQGNLETESLLGQLAQQFGKATGGRGALRDAIGSFDETTGKWKRRTPNPDAFRTTMEPHDRGALLVAAVFDTFLAIYKKRTADLFRIATGGSGRLPEGDIHPDLVGRLAKEASRTAGHILEMCIRAIDYCPPVDITFGDYLRALITADADIVPVDDWHYRVAFVEAFRRWGIFPSDVRTLSVDSLRWDPPPSEPALDKFVDMLWETFFFDEAHAKLWRSIVNESEPPSKSKTGTVTSARSLDREGLRDRTRRFAAGLHISMAKLLPNSTPPKGGTAFGLNFLMGHPKDRVFEVHSVRPIRRSGPNGRTQSDLLVQITQKRPGYLKDEDMAREWERFQKGTAPPDWRREEGPDFKFRGGATFILDLDSFRLRYAITKNILSGTRMQRQRAFLSDDSQATLRSLYFGKKAVRGRQLASLHAHDDF